VTHTPVKALRRIMFGPCCGKFPPAMLIGWLRRVAGICTPICTPLKGFLLRNDMV
jgi:hypothetical protein